MSEHASRLRVHVMNLVRCTRYGLSLLARQKLTVFSVIGTTPTERRGDRKLVETDQEEDIRS